MVEAPSFNRTITYPGERIRQHRRSRPPLVMTAQTDWLLTPSHVFVEAPLKPILSLRGQLTCHGHDAARSSAGSPERCAAIETH
jgi:hypothetical protein